jgi:hypothetical protein
MVVSVSCFPAPHCPPGASCPAPLPPRLTYIVTIHGHARPFTIGHSQPRYRVRAGEHLDMAVAVTLPKHLRLTDLWLGMSAGTWGNSRRGPVGMKPVLAHVLRLLPAGAHMFRLRWRVPAGRPGRLWYLVSAWSSHRPPGSVAGAIAVLVVR